jgi:hypothetical protein
LVAQIAQLIAVEALQGVEAFDFLKPNDIGIHLSKRLCHQICMRVIMAGREHVFRFPAIPYQTPVIILRERTVKPKARKEVLDIEGTNAQAFHVIATR